MFKMKKWGIIFLFFAMISQESFANDIYKNKTGIFIEGKSSIIVNSPENRSDIIAKNIKTISGGTFYNKNDTVPLQTTNTFADEKNINTIPHSFTIEKAYPNPFNPTTSVRYGISKSDHISIKIYDIIGKLVYAHEMGLQKPGWYSYTWNGRNSLDQKVSSGIYLLIIQTNDKLRSQKITMLE